MNKFLWNSVVQNSTDLSSHSLQCQRMKQSFPSSQSQQHRLVTLGVICATSCPSMLLFSLGVGLLGFGFHLPPSVPLGSSNLHPQRFWEPEYQVSVTPTNYQPRVRKKLNGPIGSEGPEKGAGETSSGFCFCFCLFVFFVLVCLFFIGTSFALVSKLIYHTMRKMLSPD